METYDRSCPEEYRMLRTARQRTRAVREDKCKLYRRLYRELRDLKMARKRLPMIKLEKPYQRGWKRHFVLRADVRLSDDGPFYEALLVKINQVQYWHDETFRRKKRGSKKKIRIQDPPKLKEYSYHDWLYKPELNEKERACFHLEWRQHKDSNGRNSFYWVYVFSEPWRYVVAIKPNIITHVRLHDVELEQKIARLTQFLYSPDVQRVTLRYLDGKVKYAGYWERRRPGYNPNKNKPLHEIVGENEENKK